MTYLQFHLIFTLPLFVLVLILNLKNSLTFSKPSILGTLLLLFLAFSYTTPWDSYLINSGIWSYESGRILGTWLLIPYEEYFFFFIQTLIGCFITSYFLAKSGVVYSQSLSLSKQRTALLTISLMAIPLIFWLTPIPEQMTYLSLVLVWGLPIVILQWFFGFKTLLQQKKVLLGVVCFLCLYFWAADSIAIKQQVWTFPKETISGLNLLGILPIEEALFFALTNLMVVQGYILFMSFDYNSLKKSPIR